MYVVNAILVAVLVLIMQPRNVVIGNPEINDLKVSRLKMLLTGSRLRQQANERAPGEHNHDLSAFMDQGLTDDSSQQSLSQSQQFMPSQPMSQPQIQSTSQQQFIPLQSQPQTLSHSQFFPQPSQTVLQAPPLPSQPQPITQTQPMIHQTQLMSPSSSLQFMSQQLPPSPVSPLSFSPPQTQFQSPTPISISQSQQQGQLQPSFRPQQQQTFVPFSQMQAPTQVSMPMSQSQQFSSQRSTSSLMSPQSMLQPLPSSQSMVQTQFMPSSLQSMSQQASFQPQQTFMNQPTQPMNIGNSLNQFSPIQQSPQQFSQSVNPSPQPFAQPAAAVNPFTLYGALPGIRSFVTTSIHIPRG